LKNKITEFSVQSTDPGKSVKFSRLDDAGRNVELEKACKQQHLAVKFEYRGPIAPQRKGKVERKFLTIYGRICAMYNKLGIEGKIRTGL
jgi:hypothetical protein